MYQESKVKGKQVNFIDSDQLNDFIQFEPLDFNNDLA